MVDVKLNSYAVSLGVTIEPVVHQLWQFETQDVNTQSFRVFLMYFIVEAIFLAYAGLRVNLILSFFQCR